MKKLRKKEKKGKKERGSSLFYKPQLALVQH
jgi:hypothetical protein